MDRLLLIGLGGAIGSVLRYIVSTSTHQWMGRSFPYGTLSVNAIGSFLIGFLFIILLDRVDGFSDTLRSFLIIGFLGGFTTFSSFSMETINLIENGEFFRSFLNIMISLILCLSLTWLGILLGRQL